MKRSKSIIIGAIILFCQYAATQAQEADSVVAARQSMRFADSLNRAWFYQEWKTYTDLSCYSAIKYYGGPDAYKEHVTTLYYRNEPQHDEKPETLKLLELRNLDNQWQCVIEKVRKTFISDKKAIVTSYLIGQSTDDGHNWKFVDVGQNKLENLIVIMPTIFTDLTIPNKSIVYPDEVVAQSTPEPTPAATVKKKPAPKKR